MAIDLSSNDGIRAFKKTSVARSFLLCSYLFIRLGIVVEVRLGRRKAGHSDICFKQIVISTFFLLVEAVVGNFGFTIGVAPPIH
jgi:nitrate reductase NapE component